MIGRGGWAMCFSILTCAATECVEAHSSPRWFGTISVGCQGSLFLMRCSCLSQHFHPATSLFYFLLFLNFIDNPVLPPWPPNTSLNVFFFLGLKILCYRQVSLLTTMFFHSLLPVSLPQMHLGGMGSASQQAILSQI